MGDIWASLQFTSIKTRLKNRKKVVVLIKVRMLVNLFEKNLESRQESSDNG